MAEKKFVMVVDDDPNVGSILKVKLEKTGLYEVLYFNNGREALAAAKSRRPDLMVLDFNMPGQDGGQVKNALAEAEETKDLPVVFLTSLLTAEEASQRGDRVGGQPMISKHLEMPEIISKIQSYLDRPE